LSKELAEHIRQSLLWCRQSTPDQLAGFDEEIIEKMKFESVSSGYSRSEISSTFEEFSSYDLKFCIEVVATFARLKHEKQIGNRITQDLISMQDQLNELSGMIEDIE